MPLFDELQRYFQPALTDEEEQALKILFDPAINLLHDSILPDYLPKVENELLKFINHVQEDCRAGCISYNETSSISQNLYDYIMGAISLDRQKVSLYYKKMNVYLKHDYNKLLKYIISGVILGAVGLSSLLLTMSLLNEKSYHYLFSAAGVLVNPITGCIGGIYTSYEIINTKTSQLNKVKSNVCNFFKMNQESSHNFSKSYYQLAKKISNAVSESKSNDDLIDIIRRNMQNMKEEKVIKNDIAEGTFLRRLLDAYVNVVVGGDINKSTLRDYLKDKGSHTEIQEIVQAQLIEIRRSNELEEEGIRENSSMRVFNLV
jgi:hypothetical protein